MSWAESEKLNEWILRAYENGRREEQDRIIELIEDEINRVSNPMLVDREYLDGLEVAITLIKGELTECECDPCGNENCNCQGKRCAFCRGQD